MKQIIKGAGFADVMTSSRSMCADIVLSRIKNAVDWTIVSEMIDAAYSKGRSCYGRPYYDGSLLMRMELLREWYRLSDKETAELVNDRISFSRFVGVTLEEKSPTRTTLRAFRLRLTKSKEFSAILHEIIHQLEHKGIRVKNGKCSEVRIIRINPVTKNK